MIFFMPGSENIDTTTEKYIVIKGAREHNLKNVDLSIPKNKLIVITGLSGSGKSSLAFDTIFAEGQRRYIESLSAYARQFLGKMHKPNVDLIHGISPAIAIEQKIISRNPRSTVGTSTEIYDYLKLLFSRIGKTYSPVSGKLVEKHNEQHVRDFVGSLEPGLTVMVGFPFSPKYERTPAEELQVIVQQGYSRVFAGDHIMRIDELDAENLNGDVFVINDRLVSDPDSHELNSRVAESAQASFFEGKGTCVVVVIRGEEIQKETFTNRFEADGMTFEEPSPNFFSFNNPYGACKRCEGYGSIIGIDEDLVVPNKALSIYEEAIACWRGEKMGEWKDQLVMNAYKFDFPVHKPFYMLTSDQKKLLWDGNKYFNGLTGFFEYVEQQAYKIQYRVMLSRYRGKTICPECRGTRLRKDASFVRINGKSISDIVLMPVSEVFRFFGSLRMEEQDKHISRRLLIEINSRLQFLMDVGLGYLTLNRLSNTLSGGESQRICLATSLGSSLVGSLYILDEPSIGLHSRDTERLIHTLRHLRDAGNTVIVVEHDEAIMLSADQIIDMGLLAGKNGGELIFQGSPEAILNDKKSLTASYLRNELRIDVPSIRRPWRDYIEIRGARENNLKNLNVRFPLNCFTVVTGVSGSGKTSLVKSILYPAMKRMLGGYAEKTGKFDECSGDFQQLGAVEMVDQNPIGKSSRSNPATYVKAWDEIRNLFAELPLAKLRGYKPGYFSFNIPGGRCDECEGEGIIKIEMQFMADIHMTCETCNGKRFKNEVLDIQYHEKNVDDLLNMTIDQAIDFFSLQKKSGAVDRIVSRLLPLQKVGLGYLGLGQPSNTLSGGEAQRVKLAYFLSLVESAKPTLFIFDEPTTGLHFHDINNLLTAFNELIRKGHSVVVIEHNPDVIKTADWVIDLGPEGGEDGGNIIFEGVPEELVKCTTSYTGNYLIGKLNYKQ